MPRRTGMTLVEVLVAIFIMAIGLLALLTLFPIGMLRMMQAIRDARSAEAAHIADKLAIMQNLRNDPLVVSVPGDPYNNGLLNPDVFRNPYPLKKGLPFLPNANDYGESYPILVDPIGYSATFGAAQDWVGGIGYEGVLRRRRVNFVIGANATLTTLNTMRNFSLWDDIGFESTTFGSTQPGTPQPVGSGSILRDSRTSWAYLLRRPQTIDRSIVDCSIVVFDKRPLSLSNNLALEEYVYLNTTYFNPTNNTITIDYGPQPPPLRTGDWILDSTLVQTPTSGSAHAYFYRVVATEDFVVGGISYGRYEVQNPIRGFTNQPTPGLDPIDGSPAYLGTAIVIPGIAEVFEKGPVRLP